MRRGSEGTCPEPDGGAKRGRIAPTGTAPRSAPGSRARAQARGSGSTAPPAPSRSTPRNFEYGTDEGPSVPDSRRHGGEVVWRPAHNAAPGSRRESERRRHSARSVRPALADFPNAQSASLRSRNSGAPSGRDGRPAPSSRFRVLRMGELAAQPPLETGSGSFTPLGCHALWAPYGGPRASLTPLSEGAESLAP